MSGDSAKRGPQAREPWLEVIRVGKRFPGVCALDGVSLSLRRGEVLAVIGENGAGKSTLMKILAGIQRPDEGEIRLDGQAVSIDSTRDAARLGIALIHQELNLADNLDVGANLFLGREPRRLGFVRSREIDTRAGQLLAQVGLNVSPRTKVAALSVAQQQLVEIAKALAQQARILIMDEPTSSLSQHESEKLFIVIDTLRGQGVGIVYISHRLGEIQRLADRVVVLRDGRNADELPRGEITHDRMVRAMVGRDLSQFYAHRPHRPGATALAVSGLRTRRFPQHELSFEVAAGEIVGLAGLVGAGRSEALLTLFGVTPALAGDIAIAGRPVEIRAPRQAIDAGLALVPEDRKSQGLVLSMSVEQNISLRVCGAIGGLAARSIVGTKRRRRPKWCAACASKPPANVSSRSFCPAAINRRSCWANGCRWSPACCCSTNRRAASTSAPSTKSTNSWNRSPNRAWPCSSSPAKWRKSSAWPIECWSCTKAN